MVKEDEADVIGDSLIPVINKLQDIFSQVSVDLKLGLPQVAVVGSQSSGKSSVLEALVGRDFLPRGPDICTRRPLVLQLIKTPAAGDNSSSNGGSGSSSGKAQNGAAAAGAGGRQQGKEWGEFLHAPGKVFYDFDRIRAEIASETDRVSGGNKNISDKPIRLKIFSPNVLTMTLIDLPGITKVPVGDQPTNIEQRIREMILQYIREPSCIILAVSASNTDLANSDALQMAQLVDAEGARTIGVLTKLDIMDRGTNALAALANLVVPLRLGYVAVVNRSQADIISNKSMGAARNAERQWFAAHPEYADVQHQCGVGNLAKRINVILGNHIRLMLPTLRRQISEALEAKSAELAGYGPPLDLGSEAARGAALLQLLCGYAERFGALLQGHSEDLPLSELMGGARIRHIFQEVFARQLRSLDPFRELTDDDVRTAIKNSSGVAGTLLIPQEPFELLVRRSIGRLTDPALNCKELVHEELLKIAEAAAPRDLGRFPALQRRLAGAVLEYIQSGAEPAEKMIRELVACEHEYINTDHPDFIGGTRAVKAVMEQREARKAAAAEGADGRMDLHKAKSTPMLAAGQAGGGTPTQDHHHSRGAGGGGGVGLGGGAMGLKGLRDSSSSSVLAASNDLLAGRGRGGAPLRSPLLLDYEDGSSGNNSSALLGSSYSLSHGNAGSSSSSSRPEGSGSSNSGSSWFGWLAKVDRSRDNKGGEGGDGGGGGDMVGCVGVESKPRNEHEEVQVEVIRLLVSNYFDIVRNNLADLVPKALMRFLVHHSQRGLQQHLIAKLYRDSLAEELLAERDDVAEARNKAQTAVEALQAACATLDGVPSELAASLSSAAAASSPSVPSKGGPRALEGGFGGAFGAAAAGGDGGGSASSSRRFERHPSQHIAAQIASSTSLAMVASAAAAESSGAGGSKADGMPAILEVDVSVADVTAADGGPVSVRAFQVEVEEH